MSKYLLLVFFGIILYLLCNSINGFSIGGPSEGDSCFLDVQSPQSVNTICNIDDSNVEEIIKPFLFKGVMVLVLYLKSFSLFLSNFMSPVLFFPNLKFLLINNN